MIKKTLKKIIFKHKSSETAYIKHLKKIGCCIGDGTRFYDYRSIIIDETRPYLITIGKNVRLTHGVMILTHGFDYSVLVSVYGEQLGSSGKVTIGDNVFIGARATILKGVTIGNNVIIGAGSLVNKDIPDNVVYAGNPAKFIMTLDDYYLHRKKSVLSEAKELVLSYINRHGKIPPEMELAEFFPLYHERDLKQLSDKNLKLICKPEEQEYVEDFFLNSQPLFKGYEEFINYCLDKEY